MASKKKTRSKKRIRAPLAKRTGPNGATTPPNPGQGDDGKFLPGNQIGGNPTAGAQMRFRATLQRIADEVEKDEQGSRFERLAVATFKKALEGQEWAAKELFARLCGKHPVADFDDAPPPPPLPLPDASPGDVTINTQVNHNYPALPAAAQIKMEKLIERGLAALEADKMIDQEE